MTIMDRQLLLSSAQAVTVTAVSTNAIDLTFARSLGINDDLHLFAKVVTAFSGGTSLQIAFISSANADLSTPTILAQTPAIPTASLTAGSEWLRISVPIFSGAAQRYLGASYTVVGTFGAGAITTGLIFDREAIINYASGLNTGAY
jgi:hypothetical protein